MMFLHVKHSFAVIFVRVLFNYLFSLNDRSRSIKTNGAATSHVGATQKITCLDRRTIRLSLSCHNAEINPDNPSVSWGK